MLKFVAVCVAVFVLAVGYIVVSEAGTIAALFEAFRAEPFVHKLAWLLAVLAAVVLIPAAVWLCDALIRQRRANEALELRMIGVRDSVRGLAGMEVDADAAVHHLARTDPESAIAAIADRLSEAERIADIQAKRNEVGDLQSRVDDLRTRQERLRERLAPILQQRQSIEALFSDVEAREADIGRALAEITGGEDATAIALRLESLGEFVRRSHERCGEIESEAKALAGLRQDYTDLRGRLAPFTAAKDGIKRRLKDLDDARTRLAADIEAMQQTPQGALDARVQQFTDEKRKLDDALAALELQFSTLATLRQDVETLSGKFEGALDRLAISKSGDAKARTAELSQFIKATQTRFDAVERTMVDFGQLRAKLAELQARLVPIEATDGGVADLIAQVGDLRDRLAAQIAGIETDEHGGLAARVNAFIDSKQDLEKRVSNVTEQFSRLATLRSD